MIKNSNMHYLFIYFVFTENDGYFRTNEQLFLLEYSVSFFLFI